jgi:hypothetical protein
MAAHGHRESAISADTRRWMAAHGHRESAISADTPTSAASLRLSYRRAAATAGCESAISAATSANCCGGQGQGSRGDPARQGGHLFWVLLWSLWLVFLGVRQRSMDSWKPSWITSPDSST